MDINRIKEFKQTSALGYYSSPEEYMDTLEEFTKLFYDINQVPDVVVNDFLITKKAFDDFKRKLNNLCNVLLEKINNDNDTEKDKKTTQST